MSDMSKSAPWTRPGPWVIKTSYRDSGDVAWWGDRRVHLGRWQGNSLVRSRGDAIRYDDYAEALDRAYRLRASGIINDYVIDEITRPPHHGTCGSSGRA
jgi:hypothetical protein